jgi:hypothetical protein
MSTHAGCVAAIVGAILANPLLFLLAYLQGVIFGAQGFNNGGSASFPGVKTGAEGGLVAVQMLALAHIITVGILAVVVSLVGAIVAPVLTLVWCWLFRNRPLRPTTLPPKTQVDAGSALDRPPG